jgi:hypothetical protein
MSTAMTTAPTIPYSFRLGPNRFLPDVGTLW